MGKEIALHTGFSLGIILLLFSGSYYFYEGRLTSIMLSGYFFFLLSIYAGRWLCTRWFRQSKPVLFFFYTLCSFLLILLVWFYFARTALHFPYAGFLEFSVDHSPLLILGLLAGILVKFIRTSMQKQVRDAQAAAAQRQSELNLLQSQLSPHFLFNTLNNMYGISITGPQRIPALLLRLSDLLRYSVYETKKPFVPLREELEYINNYIEFEKIRISDRLVLQSRIEQVNDIGIMIAPLVLVVFIENAFKHAKDTLGQKIHVDLSVRISGNFIQFVIGNSYREEKDEREIPGKSAGLGLANTIKRLDLLYGDRYEMKQYVEHDRYIVELFLPIMQG